jgi:hypothetical protein
MDLLRLIGRSSELFHDDIQKHEEELGLIIKEAS